MGMKIGHTGITWGIPGDPERAYRDTAELGYLGFETFGHTLRQVDFRPLVAEHGIPVCAAYVSRMWIDPEKLPAELETARMDADALKELSGETIVLACNRRPPGGLDADAFHRLADGLNEAARYCRGLGLTTGLHPHTGTHVETREDIERIMELLDPALVGFAPDTGQIAKGGSDAVGVCRRYRDRTTHVHLKDWGGSPGPEDDSGYVNYQPVGSGVLPMPELLALYADFAGWVNVELDGTDRAPRPPREAAAMSRRYLGELLGDRVAWRR